MKNKPIFLAMLVGVITCLAITICYFIGINVSIPYTIGSLTYIVLLGIVILKELFKNENK